MPLLVAIAPEQRPRLVRRRIPQAGDREVRPPGSEVGAPRSAALDDRHGGALDIDLEADLVPCARWHARNGESQNPGEVEFRDLRSGPLSHPIRAWGCQLGIAQRIEEVTDQSPALPLSYSATAAMFIEGARQRQRRRNPVVDSRSTVRRKAT